MTIIQIIPFVISAVALLLSLYTYFRHDAKIKKQNALINQFQLERFKKETDSEKKAIIEANVVKSEKGRRIIKVYNKGKATARNVIVTFPGETNLIIPDYPSSIDIRPQNSIEIIAFAYEGSSGNTLKIDFEWQDDFRLDNKDSQTLQL
ncbi:hypothetical protein ACLOAU_01680 [Niabella sp. CJ426]|uniref:hypothetical protein n=1 Tax=Niabella sp. CJ426 TaxID=3393740 RepID=UPI003D02A3FB